MTNQNNAAQPGQDDIAARLRENADLDAAEDGNPAVIRLEREAADEIERLRALLSQLRAEGVQAGDERGTVHNAAIKAAAKVCADIARQYDPQNNQENALASELYSAAAAILKLVKEGRAVLASAPVADESPMAKVADALREKARQEQQAYQERRVQSTEWGPMPHGTEADLPASAPVAGEEDHDAK